MMFNQSEFDIKLEWGLHGVETLAPDSDVIIIVDVLSFSTCVDIATNRGAIIYPYRWKDESAIYYAKSMNAELADSKRTDRDGFSLSPASLVHINSGTKLVLPSPNGSALTLATGNTMTLCGCLRNAMAVAHFAMSVGKKISIIPAGEQWAEGTLRVAVEDLGGASAIISYLAGNLSIESKSALSVFHSLKTDLLNEIKKCGSGRELIERGFEQDIHLSCELNASDNVPVYRNNAYVGENWVR